MSRKLVIPFPAYLLEDKSLAMRQAFIFYYIMIFVGGDFNNFDQNFLIKIIKKDFLSFQYTMFFVRDKLSICAQSC